MMPHAAFQPLWYFIPLRIPYCVVQTRTLLTVCSILIFPTLRLAPTSHSFL
ncbi:hypothetical protein SERLA73DRAFT_190961, partial [Serpula lacrymans var. lacrymans S7.3]